MPVTWLDWTLVAIAALACITMITVGGWALCRAAALGDAALDHPPMGQQRLGEPDQGRS